MMTTDIEAVVQHSARVEKSVRSIQRSVPNFESPRYAIILGSGLGAIVDEMDVNASLPYKDIEGFQRSTVEGHAGRLVFGTLGSVPIVVMQGRIHLYEGYSFRDVVFPTRVLIRLGAANLIVTNAAGSVNPGFQARRLMLIEDHLNLTGMNPLVGSNDPAFGPRFPDMTNAYDLEFRQIAKEVAEEEKIALYEGVYAGLLGPSYETPAEVRMLRVLGADAVGMSTVGEVITARHMGARILGISCLSNQAAGVSPVPLSHDEVREAASAVQHDLTKLLKNFVAKAEAR